MPDSLHWIAIQPIQSLDQFLTTLLEPLRVFTLRNRGPYEPRGLATEHQHGSPTTVLSAIGVPPITQRLLSLFLHSRLHPAWAWVPAVGLRCPGSIRL